MLGSSLLLPLLFNLVKSDGIATIYNSPVGVTGKFLLSQQESGTVMLVQVDGLDPNSIHGLHIYNKADTCYAAVDHYNPENTTHGGLLDQVRHAGDLGNIQANSTGSVFGKLEFGAKLELLNGLSIGITERQDDTGRSNSTLSKIDGNSGKVIACGVVNLIETILSGSTSTTPWNRGIALAIAISLSLLI